MRRFGGLRSGVRGRVAAPARTVRAPGTGADISKGQAPGAAMRRGRSAVGGARARDRARAVSNASRPCEAAANA